MKKVDECYIDQEGVKQPWWVIEKMRDIMKEKAETANHPNKQLIREGQKRSYEGLLSYKELLPKDDRKVIHMSGVIAGIDSSNDENRRVLIDCGGIATVREFVLDNCGGYKEGDRVVITISPCEADQNYYPPKPIHLD